MPSGESQWITGPEARLQGHRLRAEHDSIMVGVETVLSDDPILSARVPGETLKQPVRVVLDSRLRTPENAKVLGPGTLIFTAVDASFLDGAEVVKVTQCDHGRPAIPSVLEELSRRGFSSLLVEGGGRVAASFIKLGCVDRIEWFRAPVLLGQEGRPGVANLGFDRLSDTPRFKRLAVSPLGDDLWERYEKV